MRDYKALLEHSFSVESEAAECPTDSRLEFLSRNIFDFTTYDSAMDVLFARKAVEVCDVITNRATFEYIGTEDGNLWYLLMCNMPFFADRIDWGTSIRGAWWAPGFGKQIEFQSCGLWSEGDQLSETMTFSTEEWESFMRAVSAFAAPEMG